MKRYDEDGKRMEKVECIFFFFKEKGKYYNTFNADCVNARVTSFSFKKYNKRDIGFSFLQTCSRTNFPI